MNSVKKIIATLLTCMMVITLFSGCGQKETQSQNNEAVKDQKKEPIKLKFSCFDYETSKYDKALIESFIGENPDIDVQVLDIPAKEYSDKLTIMLAGGEAIDVFYAKENITYGSLILKNQLLKLDDLIAKDKIDTKAYGSSIENLKVDGKTYGLPYRNDYWLLYYNKDLFDKAGISYPSNDWTWSDYKKVAKKLTTGEGTNKIYGTYIQPWASPYFLMGLQKGQGSLVDGSYSMLEDGLNFLLDIQNKDKSAADFATNKSMSAHYKGMFEKGNIGMIYMGSWFIGTLIKDKKDGNHNVNFGIAQIPVLEGQEKSTLGVVTPVVINANTKNVEASWKLAKFIGGEKGAKILAKHSVMTGYFTDEIMKLYSETPGFPKDNEGALKINKVYLEWPAHKLSGLLGKMVEEEIGMIMTNNKSVTDGIKDMEKRRKEIKQQNQ